MATNVVFVGIQTGAITQAALLEPVGQQKQKYSQLVSAELGSNPRFELWVGSTRVYQATISGSLPVVSGSIVLPTQFLEPPTVNLTGSFAGTDAKMRIQNANNSSVYLEVPVRIANGEGYLAITKNTDGTNAVRSSGTSLKAPLILDVGGGSGGGLSPTISLNALIANMTQQSEEIPTFAGGIEHRKKQAGGYASNYAATKAAIDAGPTTSVRMYDYIDEILPWFWPYAGSGHNDGIGLRLQYDAGIISVLRASTMQWEDSPLRRGPTFNGYVWLGNDQTPPPYNDLIDLEDFGDYFDHSDGSRSSEFTGDWGAELWYTGWTNIRDLWVGSRSIALIAKARVIDANHQPYYGDEANYLVTLGYDLYGRSAPVGQRQSNGTWGTLVDGWSNRWVRVTNGDWRSIAMVVMDPYNKDPGNANTQDYNADFPWCLPPWVPTEQEIRDHPPNWCTFP